MNRANISSTGTELDHWEAFIKVFVPFDCRERWLALVKLGYRRWGDLPIADFIGYEVDPGVAHIEKVKTSDLTHYISTFRVAPSHGCLILITRPWKGGEIGSKAFLCQDLARVEGLMLEGIVSIVPGEIALVVDHEGSTLCCVSTKIRNRV